MNDKYDPVLISLIRRLRPNIIAENICSVQPMSNPYSKEEYPYQIDILEFAQYNDVIPMRKWCSENFNKGEWANTVQYFAFKTEEQLTWFRLAWI